MAANKKIGFNAQPVVRRAQRYGMKIINPTAVFMNMVNIWRGKNAQIQLAHYAPQLL
jgi:hypothetical protein